MYRLANGKQTQFRGFTNMWCINYEDRRVLTKDKKLIKIWRKNFMELLNEKFPREVIEWNLSIVVLIREKKVWRAIIKMIKNFNKVLIEGKIPEAWSCVALIFKDK